jgi:hypothetical protein
MITLPDKVRAAAEATAQEITRDSIPDWSDFALRADSGRERGTQSSRRRVRSRWHSRSRWLAPVAAAVAVLAVIAVSAGLAAGHPGSPAPAASTTRTSIGPLPRYYAMLTSSNLNWPYHLVVADARTGATLASAFPPRNYSDDDITAAADDTTFVVGTVRMVRTPIASDPMTLNLAQFNPARKTITMRPLPIPPLPGSMPVAIALSPDGRELAVVVHNVTDRMITSSTLSVYSLATGAVRAWTAPGFVDSLGVGDGLSWGPGGLLAFEWSRSSVPRPAAGGGIRLLDTNGPGGNLLTASRAAVPGVQPDGQYLQATLALIDHGSEVVSVVGNSPVGSGVVSEFEVFSTRTGRVLRAFLRSRRIELYLLSANPAGTVIVGEVPGPDGRASPLEWITPTRQIPIKGLPANGDFLGIAF